MELAYIFGTRSEIVASNGQPLRTSAGIIAQLGTNVKAYNNSTLKFNVGTHMTDLAKVFDYDAGGAGNERIILCGNGYRTELDKACRAENNVRITFGETIKAWGMDLQKVYMPQGTFYIKSHPLFNTHPVWTNSALVLNPKGLIDRYLRKTAFEDNIQVKGDDFIKGQWLTESGPEVHFEGSHAYFSNCIYTA
jgi:hypothetical protein